MLVDGGILSITGENHEDNEQGLSSTIPKSHHPWAIYNGIILILPHKQET